MLISKFKNSLGKSSHGGQTLYDHIMGCAKVVYRVLDDSRFVPDDYPKQKRDQLFVSIFIHDIGKLDHDFQDMLLAARDDKPFPPKRVKHEASTLDFEALFMETQDEVREHLSEVFNYRFTEPVDLEDAIAFAVSHHGLFYLSFEERDGKEVPRIRREWTVFNYAERRRITLTDLLFDYHPLGGLVIIADLLGSFCYEQEIPDADDIIRRANSLRELIDILLQEGAVRTVEQSVQEYDPSYHGLRDLMTLLAGGLV